MLNQLLDEFDNNEDLVENIHAQKAPVDVAYNKQEEIAQKYAVTAPTVIESRP